MSFAGLVTGLVNRTQIYRALQGSYRLCALFSLLCAGTSIGRRVHASPTKILKIFQRP
jgi:hypothetical protein